MEESARQETNKRVKPFFEKRAVQWFILLGVFFGTVAAIFVLNDNFYNDFLSYSSISPLKPRERTELVRVTIDFGNGKRRAFEGSVPSPITAAEALRAAEEAGGFSLKITLAGEVAEIDGVKAGSRKWNWYLNGNPESRPILDVMVAGGDKILVKYE